MDAGGTEPILPPSGLTERNLYVILNVDIKASQESIRRSYLKLARRWHPDRHRPGIDQQIAKKKFQEISAAFHVLSNTSRRSQYDLGLLDLLDVEDYLARFQGLILTASGLGMGSAASGSSGGSDEEDGSEEDVVTSMSSLQPTMSLDFDGSGRSRWLLTAC